MVWHRGIARKAASCDAIIPCGHWFDFLSSSMLMHQYSVPLHKVSLGVITSTRTPVVLRSASPNTWWALGFLQASPR